MNTIYRVFTLLILFALIFKEIFAQPVKNSISGMVLDIATKEPLSNANIYISNTTWGTTSNLDGKFRLSEILPGSHEIVFSMIGYQSQSRKIKLDDSSQIYLTIEMIPKIYNIKEITVIANRPDEWFDDLAVFKKKFLGYSPYSIKCKIINEYVLNFSHPRKDFLVAESDYPIEIINYDLGYNLKVEIDKFEYDLKTRSSRFAYRIFFTELDTNDSDVKDQWKRQRQKKFKESLSYFFRSLIEDKYNEEGFEIALVYKPGNKGLEILSSPELIEEDTTNGIYKIHFTDFLQVINTNIKIEKSMTSWIKLNYSTISIDKYGYPLENNAITLSGYWSKLGIASFLPKYYAFIK